MPSERPRATGSSGTRRRLKGPCFVAVVFQHRAPHRLTLNRPWRPHALPGLLRWRRLRLVGTLPGRLGLLFRRAWLLVVWWRRRQLLLRRGVRPRGLSTRVVHLPLGWRRLLLVVAGSVQAARDGRGRGRRRHRPQWSRTGAHVLAWLGWARWQFQFLARHSTGQIDTHVGEAFATQAHDWVDEALRKGGADSACPPPALADPGLEDLVTKLAEEVKLLRGSALGPSAGEAICRFKAEGCLKSGFVKGDAKVHMVPSGSAVGPAYAWLTLCGWGFGKRGAFEWTAEAEPFCDRCAGLLGRRPLQAHGVPVGCGCLHA